MHIVGNIFLCFTALSVGSALSFVFALARSASTRVRYALMACTAVAVLSLSLIGDNNVWKYGVLFGHAAGLFALSMCIVSGDAEAAEIELIQKREEALIDVE